MWPSSLGLPTQHFLRFAGQLQVQRNRQQKASHSRKIKTQLPEKKNWIPICPQIATKIKPHLLQKYVSPYFMHRLPKYKRTNQVNGVCKIMSAFTSTLRSLDSGWQGWCIPSRLTSLIVCCSSFCFGNSPKNAIRTHHSHNTQHTSGTRKKKVTCAPGAQMKRKWNQHNTRTQRYDGRTLMEQMETRGSTKSRRPHGSALRTTCHNCHDGQRQKG